MKINKTLLLKIWNWRRIAAVQWLAMAAILALISWFFMGRAITTCSTATVAFNSDSSGGLAWFQWASGNDLTWEPSAYSNYPVGEPLNRPFSVTSALFSGIYKILASLTTPICGLNLITLLGYVSTGLLMFGLVRWLFKNNGIAAFASISAAFVPYHQFKAQSHIIYMYSTPFIAILWAFLWLVQKPSVRRALLLAVLSVIPFYMDGYFPLLTATLVASLLLLTLFRDTLLINLSKGYLQLRFIYSNLFRIIKKCFKPIVITGILSVTLLMPLVYTIVSQGSKIQSSLSSARGDINIEAKEYSVRAIQFIAPPYNSTLFPNNAEIWRAITGYSNVSESTLYIGYTVLLLVVIVLVLSGRKKIREKELQPNISFAYVIYISLGTFLLCLALSMPPFINLLGHNFPTPTAILIKLTANWRVLARMFLVLHPLLVILASAGLYAIKQTVSKRWFYTTLTACVVLIMLEFTPQSVHKTSDLQKNTPKIFKTLGRDKNVVAIAEYPLLNLLYTPTTFTFQQVHGKKVLNANDSAIILDPFNQSIAGINNIQTLGVLRSRGISHLISYDKELTNPKLIKYGAVDSSQEGAGIGPIFSYIIPSDITLRPDVLVPSSGFDPATVDDKNYLSHHVLSIKGVLTALNTKTELNSTGNHLFSFDIQRYGDTDSPVTIFQNGKAVWHGLATEAPSTVNLLLTGSSLTVVPDLPVDLTNLSVVAK